MTARQEQDKLFRAAAEAWVKAEKAQKEADRLHAEYLKVRITPKQRRRYNQLREELRNAGIDPDAPVITVTDDDGITWHYWADEHGVVWRTDDPAEIPITNT